MDGRLSPSQTLIGPNYNIGANLGRQVGGNLFHSFGAFSLSQNETATFSGPASVRNVIGRVTGGAPSSIDGTVRSTIPGANVYLINPKGIVFGEHATVDVSGSFHASSADYIRMSDGARFQAANPDASTLTAAEPSAFGFLSPTPGSVSVNGSTLGPVPGRLALVGGPVTISKGTLLAPGGTIHVASAADPGEIPVDPKSGPSATVKQYGPVQIANGRIATSNPAGGGSGNVTVRGDTVSVAATEIDTDATGASSAGSVSVRGDTAVNITDGTNIHAYTVDGPGGSIDISAGTQGTTLIGGASLIAAATQGRGAAGAITIESGQLSVQGGTSIINQTLGPGAGGSVNIMADATLITGTRTIVAARTLAGVGGGMFLSGSRLTISDGASASTSAVGNGQGGALAVNMSDSVTVGASGASGFGGEIATIATGAATGGNLEIRTGNLAIHGFSGVLTGSLDSAIAGFAFVQANSINLTDQAFISSNGYRGLLGLDGSSTRSLGTSGAVTVLARDSISLSGGNADALGAFIGTSTESSQPAGSVQVGASSISLKDAAYVGSFTYGAGKAGDVTVAASGPLLIERPADLRESSAKPGIVSISHSDQQSGASGNVTVSAHDITIQNGVINADSDGSGPAGNVSVTALDRLSVTGPGSSDSNGDGDAKYAGISAQSYGTGTAAGKAGGVTVYAQSVDLKAQGEIITKTFGGVDAGDVVVRARSGISIEGGNQDVPTGITSQTGNGKLGNAGDVHVEVGSLTMSGAGAEIGSLTFGDGNAGNVELVAHDGISITSTGATKISGILSQADIGSSGNAGSVHVEAGSLTLAGTTAEISTQTFGKGDAGELDVTVHGDISIAGTSSSKITGIVSQADVGSSGQAGPLHVQADRLIISGSAAVISSQTFGTKGAGDVDVVAPGGISITGTNPQKVTGITSQANEGSTGKGGNVHVQTSDLSLTGAGAEITVDSRGAGDAGALSVEAGSLSMGPGALITTRTFGSGAGGNVSVKVAGSTTIGGGGGQTTGVVASAETGASGPAGSVNVTSGSLSLSGGGQIASSTSGAGKGGTVDVSVPSNLVLSGAGTRISASADGPASESAGTVTVNAGSIALQDGAKVSSTTAGTGKGGDVNVAATGDVSLQGSGTQITAGSSGSGPAGSITLSARRVNLTNGAAITTDGQTADGGRITITASDMAYLQGSAITTSVQAEKGNGGDILIDPRFVVLNDSAIRANAIGGNGGHVQIIADEIVRSADSAITASSQTGLAGEVVITGPQVDLNSTLVVLASTLRSAAAVLQESCATRGDRPRSTLAPAGQGGLRDEAQTTLPALYLAHRPVRSLRRDNPTEPVAEKPVRVTLAVRCQ